MKLNINELEVILSGLIELNNTKNSAFTEYGIDYKELYEKINTEVNKFN